MVANMCQQDVLAITTQNIHEDPSVMITLLIFHWYNKKVIMESVFQWTWEIEIIPYVLL